MKVHVSLTADLMSPDLQARFRAASDKRGIHEAMGLAVIGITKRAFNDAGLRAAAWPNLANGQPARLRKSGTLAKSVRVVSASASGVVVGSDRLYAAIHQLGGKTRPHVIRPKNGKALFWPGAKHPVKKVNHPGSKIPARPFFPFLPNGQPSAAGHTAILQALEKKLAP